VTLYDWSSRDVNSDTVCLCTEPLCCPVRINLITRLVTEADSKAMLGETPPFTMLHGSSFSAETARGYLPIGSPLPQIRSFNGRSIKTQRSVTPNEEPAWPPLHNVKRAPMRSYSIANDQSYKYGAPGPYGFALSPDQTIATTRRPQDDDGLLETCFAALVNGGRDDFYAAVGGPSSSGSSPSEVSVACRLWDLIPVYPCYTFHRYRGISPFALVSTFRIR
jgi:hypothetical protein